LTISRVALALFAPALLPPIFGFIIPLGKPMLRHILPPDIVTTRGDIS